MKAETHMPQLADEMENSPTESSGNRQTTRVNGFSTSTTWVMEIDFRSFDVVTSAFIYWVLSPAHWNNFLKALKQFPSCLSWYEHQCCDGTHDRYMFIFALKERHGKVGLQRGVLRIPFLSKY